jgi:hypothetical protein
MGDLPRRGPWLWMGVFAAGFLFLTALGLILWFHPEKQAADPPGHAESRAIGPHLAAARAALTQGSFETAHQELSRVRTLPGWEKLTEAERRDLVHLQRQAALLADLLEVSLQEIVRHARETAQGEWQLVFAKRYRGKAVLLDAEGSQDGAGRLRLDHLVRVGGVEARVLLDDLDLVQRLVRQSRLDHPQRLILGVRLESVGQEPNGSWVIRLQPASGVLMTDRSALGGACPDLLKGPDLDEVLKRQMAWWTEVGDE